MRGLRYLRIFTCALAALATLEFCARLEDWVHFRAPFWEPYDVSRLFINDQSGSKGVPNARFENIQLNSLGYRGPEPRSGTIRIVCLGASETFGISEGPDKQFPRQLEARLNRDLGVSSIEVLNISRPSRNLLEDVRELPQIIEQFHPQFLVFYPSAANYGTLEYHGLLYGSPPATPPASSAAALATYPLPSKVRAVLSRLAARGLGDAGALAGRFTGMLARGYDMLRLKRKIAGLRWVVPSDSARDLGDRLSLRWYRLSGGFYFDRFPAQADEHYRRDLRKAADLASGGGARLVLVLHANNIPDPVRADDVRMMRWNYYYPYTSGEGLVDLENRLNRVTAEVASERGLTLVDARHGIPKDPRYFSDFVHFTDEGAARMAELIAQQLEPPLREVLQEKKRGIE